MPLREQPPRPSPPHDRRAAVRALRSARAASLTDAAAAAGCAPEQLRAELVHAIDRNACAAAARAAALGDGPSAIRAAAAAHHMCPPSAAAALKDDPNSAVRVAAADLRQRCRYLAASADPYNNLAAAAAASHPPTLMKLVCDALACEVVASNPACPQAGLWLAAEWTGVLTPAAAASNPQCGPLLLERLASDPAGITRAAAASNPQCGPLLLERLASDEYWKVRADTASNQRCPTAVLLRMLDEEPAVSQPAAQNPSLRALAISVATETSPPVRAPCDDSAEELSLPLNETSINMLKFAAAKDPSCPPETLAQLTRTGTFEQRLAAAANPSCPPKRLVEAVAGDDIDLRTAAASNPSLPDDALRRAVISALEPSPEASGGTDGWSKDTVMRSAFLSAVARNRACPPETLGALAATYDAAESVASNPASGADTLMSLSVSANPRVRKCVAAHSSTPASALARLAHDDVKRVRSATAQNHAVSVLILAQMMSDPDGEVRTEATTALAKRSRCARVVV